MIDRDFGQVTSLIYRVETAWPDTSKPEDKVSFGSYYAHGYTDIRDPGNKYDKMLINTEPELFDKRCSYRFIGTADGLLFENKEDAIAVAQFLQKWGRMGAGWDSSSQEIHQKRYRGPLKVRVVEEFISNTRTNIKFEHVSPADDFETELSALMKKHGKTNAS